MQKRAYLTRSALLKPRSSPWMQLLNNAEEISFLEMTCFNFETFRRLRNIIFSEEIAEMSSLIRKKRGRPTSLDFDGELGLFLYYINSMMKIKHLCQLFGVVPATASFIINKLMKRSSIQISIISCTLLASLFFITMQAKYS